MSASKKIRFMNPALFGILCALGGTVAFSTNDMGIKLLSGDYPLHQIVLTRAIIGLTFTLAFFVPLDGGLEALKTRKIGLHAFRGLLVVMANTAFFAGLAALPLGEATSIFFISPLVITTFAFLFLGERAGIHRWAAVVAGLLGVIIMIRPGGDTFQFAALLPIIAATCYAALHMMTRIMGSTERASTMALYIQLIFVLVSLTVGLVVGDGRFAGSANPSIEFLLRAWVWPQLEDFKILTMIGIASAVGGYLVSQAYRQAEASLVAPFEYAALPFALFWGAFLFGEWPDVFSWIGIALIVGAGLYVLQIGRVPPSKRRR